MLVYDTVVPVVVVRQEPIMPAVAAVKDMAVPARPVEQQEGREIHLATQAVPVAVDLHPVAVLLAIPAIPAVVDKVVH